MVRKLVLAALAAALLAGLPAAAFGRTSHELANSTTYPDSTGEDAQAPDITSIQVSNDDAAMITFQVNIANRPSITPDMFVLIFVDSDQNASTGDQSTFGADYVIQLVQGAADLFQWQGNDFVRAPSQSSLTFGYAATGATLRISASDLGKTKGFKFGAIAASGVALTPSGDLDFTNVHQDLAPDAGHGFFAYQVRATLALSVTTFQTAPKPARAGRPFAVSMAVNENDTNGPVTTGTVACAATLAGARIAPSSRTLLNGIATCTFKLPSTAKGQTIRGTITVASRGASVSRPFSAKVS